MREYVNRVARESAEERGAEDREKTGVPLGRSVVNPVNGEEIPMFVADYVLMEYGTGAIMAVPGHDTPRLRVRQRLRPADQARDRGRATPRRRATTRACPTPATGRWSAPAASTARTTARPTTEIVAWLEAEGRGKPAVNYRLRDWLVSRQRYWGAPIPVVYCDECGIVPVPDDQLPVELPEVEDYAPQGKSPLAAAEDWVATECPRCGGAGPARDRHDGHLRRLLLVLHPLPRPAATTRPPGTAPRPTTGCRSTSTSAASSTRSCT